MEEMRWGVIYLSKKILHNGGVPKVLADIAFTVHRAEFLYHKQCVEYIGTSPFFRVLDEGEVTPKYSITITNGKASVHEEHA